MVKKKDITVETRPCTDTHIQVIARGEFGASGHLAVELQGTEAEELVKLQVQALAWRMVYGELAALTGELYEQLALGRLVKPYEIVQKMQALFKESFNG